MRRVPVERVPFGTIVRYEGHYGVVERVGAYKGGTFDRRRRFDRWHAPPILLQPGTRVETPFR